jgi:tetratricopeptide (TPR) repeat protein
MKRKTYIALFIIITGLFMPCSCNKNDENKMLDNTRKMMLAHPDSAYKILKGKEQYIKGAPLPTKMYYQLILCRVKDLCYIKHDNDSIMLEVVKYYRQKDDKVKLMQAYYCMGCIFRDLHDAPKALDYYQKCIKMQDKDSEYEVLSRCYSQIAQLEENCMDYHKALTDYCKALSLFRRSDDQKAYLSTLIDIGNIMHWTNKDRNAQKYYHAAEYIAERANNIEVMSNVMINEMKLYIDNNDIKEAEKIYHRAKKKLPERCLNKYGFQMGLALICRENGETDKAIAYINKASHEDNKNKRMTAYLYLEDIYANEKHDCRNALTYAMRTINMIDSINMEANMEQVERMRMSFDYERVNKKNTLLIHDNKNFKDELAWSMILLLLITTGSMGYVTVSRKKKAQFEKTIKEKSLQLTGSLLHIKRNEKEISLLKSKNDELSALKRDSLTTENNRLLKSVDIDNEKWNKFRDSNAYKKIHKTLKNGKVSCQHREMNELVEELKCCIDAIFYDFGGRLRQFYPAMNDTQMTICYLLKTELKLSDISTIMSITNSAISNARNKIRRACFESPSKLEDVDLFIHDF